VFTILIVDDNATFRAQAARLAEREGFSVVQAGNLAELTSALMQSNPDLVLVDIELPSIPGHRLGSLIRSRHDVPIVLVSALSEDRVRRLFEASDADGWICKPLTRDKLIAAVTRFVKQRGDKAAPEIPPQPTLLQKSARPRVLVVEDEDVIAARIESALAHCIVDSVSEGNTAIDRLLKAGYEAILLDLTLPELSGFDVLRHLLMHRPEMLKKTVIMTAATDESLQFIDPASVAAVLRKPFPIGELPELVDRIVKG
jgi:DNA-binding response OmpR family regulator